MKVYDRQKKEYETSDQYGQEKLRFLYENAIGRLLLRLAVSHFVSGIYGSINSRKSSARKIPGFIEKHHIDMSDFEEEDYGSFNEFFVRKIRPEKRPFSMRKDVLISPADSKLLVYGIDEDTKLFIKGREYTLDEITGGTYTEGFKGGHAFVFRLCMDDYHRYCFIDDGKVVSEKRIKGRLHTVSSFSRDHKIYKENTRQVSVLKTENFGMVIMIEVGALLVGKIVDHDIKEFKKGQEKGYFEPGGSTVIIITGDNIEVDEDIMEQSSAGIETKVRYGERIGTSRC